MPIPRGLARPTGQSKSFKKARGAQFSTGPGKTSMGGTRSFSKGPGRTSMKGPNPGAGVRGTTVRSNPTGRYSTSAEGILRVPANGWTNE
jgi:hypothetical protein